MVIHMLRTPKIPFIQSRASRRVFIFTFSGIAVGTILPFTPVGRILEMAVLPGGYYGLLAATILCYITLVTVVKKLYVHKFKEWL